MTTCPFCSYSREGIADDAPCPECGRLPRTTLPPLAEESPEHRRSLAAGARLAQLVCFARLLHLGTFAVLVFTTDQARWWYLGIGLALIASANAVAGLRLTARGHAPFRSWARPTLRAALAFDLAVTTLGGAASLVMPHLALAIGLSVALLVGWAVRSLAWIAIIKSLATRLETDALRVRINAWFTYAGVAAMTSVAGIVAVALTFLIPILAPFLVIAAIPFSLLMSVLGAIAMLGAINLHARLARELRRAI